MYNPPDFQEHRLDVLHDLIRRYSFAPLVSHDGTELVATHLPFLLDAARGPHGTLLAHMARANPQWRGFNGEREAMVLFQGPHTYVSPSWYGEQLSVPTWNYAAVHVYGRPRIVDDPDAFRALLAALVNRYESPRPAPWSLDGLPDEYVAKMLRAIVGFELPIERIEGKLKMSQNRPLDDRRRVIAALREGGESERAVADMMASCNRLAD